MIALRPCVPCIRPQKQVGDVKVREVYFKHIDKKVTIYNGDALRLGRFVSEGSYRKSPHTHY